MKLKSTLLATGILALSATTLAAETLRYAEFGPNRGWREQVHAYLAEEVSARTNGELEIQSTFGGALIKARDVLRGVGDGLADMGTIVGVYTPQQMANYRAFDIPSGNDDPFVGLAAAYEVATTNPTIQADFDEMNVVYLGNYTSSTVLLACKDPVTALSDLDGLKVRANPPHADVFKASGAVVVSMPFPEVYQALDTGIIDCAQTYWSAIFAYKHQEVATNITALNWSQNMGFGLVMNKESFERLSSEHQQVLRDIGYDATMLAAELAIGSTKAIRERILSDEAVTLHTFDAENQAALIQAGRDTANSFKGDPAVLDAYLAAVETYEGVLADQGYPWAQN